MLFLYQSNSIVKRFKRKDSKENKAVYSDYKQNSKVSFFSLFAYY